MIVYADILFFVNFITDYLCLYVTAKVLCISFKKRMLFLSSALGGVYGVLSAVFDLYEPVCGIVLSVVMVVISFGLSKFISFVKALVLLYCVGMLLGGVMTFLVRNLYIMKHFSMFENGAGLMAFLVIFTLVFLFFALCSKIFSAYLHRITRECELCFEDRCTKARFLVDPGNMLKDFYTGHGIIIVKEEVLDRLFGEDGIHKKSPLCEDAETAARYGFRLVTAKTVNGTALIPVYGAVKVREAHKGKREICAVAAYDIYGNNDYLGNDGIMPYI